MDFKEKRKDLMRLRDRDLIDRILAFADREKLNRDANGRRRQYPSAEMAVRAQRLIEKKPGYVLSDKQRFAMADSFARCTSDELKIVGITFAKADPQTLIKTKISEEGVKSVYGMTLQLVPEPSNLRDKNAVAVLAENQNGTFTRIGYLPGAYVAKHPITELMSVKGTLTDHSNGAFKTISYMATVDTEAIDAKRVKADENFVYQMPFMLNGDVKPGAGKHLNDPQYDWTHRLNRELEHWGANGAIKDVKFEFPTDRSGNIRVETERRLNSEAMQICGAYLRYNLESGVTADLKREGFVNCPENLPAINTREKPYFSLQAAPTESMDFTNAVNDLPSNDIERMIQFP